MIKHVYLAENPLDLKSWESFEVEDVCAFLVEHFGEWPRTARIYHEVVSKQTDVTPSSEGEIERLQNLEGKLFVVVYPEGVEIVVGVIVAVVVSVAASMILAPSVPNPSVRLAANRQATSPNNELQARTNQSRLNGRIPDIFGQVRSVPDLVAVPYKTFRNHIEVETSYMCVGKGEFEVIDIKDGETYVEEIAGTTVEVYAPYTSPNSGDEPQIRIGTAIDDEVVKAVAFDSVNGQTLRPPNSNALNAANNVRFVYPDVIEAQSGSNIDFTNYFAASDSLGVTNAAFSGAVQPFTLTGVSVKFVFGGSIVFQSVNPSLSFVAGDTLTLANASRTDGTNPVNLAGNYTIASVSNNTITLTNPAAVNTDWNKLDLWAADETAYGASNVGVSAGTRAGDLNGTYTVISVSSSQIVLSNPAPVNANWNKIDQLPNAVTAFGSPKLSAAGDKWIGPFFLDVVDLDRVFGNFVALNGLYKDDGSNQIRFDVVVEIELTPVDVNGNAIGAAEKFQGTVEGSATTTSTRGLTIKAQPTFNGRCKVRARRVTPADLTFAGSVVDEVKWQQVYAISPVDLTDFGNVTTVFAQTLGTSGALALKERKLNMLVTRKIPTRISGDNFTNTLTATKSVDDIISFVCLDPYIGNRKKAEVDFDSVYNTIADIKEYFGFDEAAEFNYTFDSSNLSFEETLQSMVSAVFCNAYRQGNQIKLTFEKSTDDSLLIFNHRNKIPATETRTVRFGNQDNYDGVEVEFINPDDDVADTYYIPADRSAINPQQVETMGVRSKMQAFLHAWRVWNKIQHQNVTTEFTTTHEAALAVVSTRLLIADNTRPHTQDGEVWKQNGLTLTLSQSVVLDPAKEYTIFLQHVDGSVESIAVTAGTAPNEVVLSDAPNGVISTDEANYARCTYIIVPNEDNLSLPFLLVEKNAQSGYQYSLSAINYSHLYYQQDRLQLWLNFEQNNFDDVSPFDRTGVANSGAAILSDTQRGFVFVGSDSNDFVNLPTFNAPASYTKMAWLKKNDLTTVGHILSSSASVQETFYVDADGNLAAGHLDDEVTAAFPAAGEWHHVAARYDATGGEMTLFIDGLKVAQGEGIEQRTLGPLTAFGCNGAGAFVGRGSDLRLYNGSLSDYEISEIYRASVR